MRGSQARCHDANIANPEDPATQRWNPEAGSISQPYIGNGGRTARCTPFLDQRWDIPRSHSDWPCVDPFIVAMASTFQKKISISFLSYGFMIQMTGVSLHVGLKCLFKSRITHVEPWTRSHRQIRSLIRSTTQPLEGRRRNPGGQQAISLPSGKKGKVTITEGCLEVKLPTIWTDEAAEVGRVREEKGRRKKIREEKKPLEVERR